MEEASSSRDAERTSAVVSALVQHIMLSWREHFARAVAMKFNCFFLMPFVDDFPSYLRRELEKIYEGDVGDIFDIAEARGALIRRRESLVAECKACHEIQGKFDSINSQLNNAKEIYKDGDQDLEATAAEAAAEAEADAIAEREMELAAAAAAAEAEAAAAEASTRASGTAMTRDYGGIDSLEDDEMMAFGGSGGGGGGGGGGFSSEGNGGRSFLSAGGDGFSSTAGTVAGRPPAPGYGRNFFAPSEEDSSEEDEDEDDVLFVNPVTYMGPIGEKPPPVDSF
ncbi:unnamed protein product, partial [Ectocarpus sp. 12 AP-2014]